MTPSLSVLIACYNGKNHIDRCFKSLTKQGLNDFNIIVVDDCSTDNSFELLSRWKNKFPKLTIIRNTTNLGLAKVRNIYIDAVKTDYFTMLDIDDVLPKNTLLKLCKPIIKNNILYDIVVGKTKVHVVSLKGKVTSTLPLVNTNNYCRDCNNIEKFLIKNARLTVWGALINKNYWDSLNFKFADVKTYDDITISFFMMFNAKKFYAINHCSYIYRLYKKSLSHDKNFSAEKFKEYQEQIFSFLDKIKNDSRFTNQLAKNCVESKMSAETLQFLNYQKLTSKTPESQKMFSDFKKEFYKKYVIECGLRIGNAKSWWGRFMNTQFKKVFKEEIKTNKTKT